MDISKIIGLEGGRGSTWFRVLVEEGRDKTKYYPAIVDGIELGWSDFRDLQDYLDHKVERERETIRLTVAGNAVVAEEAIRVRLAVRRSLRRLRRWMCTPTSRLWIPPVPRRS